MAKEPTKKMLRNAARAFKSRYNRWPSSEDHLDIKATVQRCIESYEQGLCHTCKAAYPGTWPEDDETPLAENWVIKFLWNKMYTQLPILSCCSCRRRS